VAGVVVAYDPDVSIDRGEFGRSHRRSRSTIMTTVIVPLDGSTYAERALRPACSIAARLEGAHVLLVHCAPENIDVAQHRLDDLAGLFSDVVDVETRLVGHGDAPEVILATAEIEPDALLCMATHGRGGIRTAVLGSVAERVIRGSTRPLVLVGPGCRTALLPTERGRLLMTSDGSDFSDSIAPVVADWCERLRLEPWVAEVVGPDENPEPADRPVPNREVAAAERRLGELSNRLGHDTAARTHVLHGEPSHSIAAFAERLPAGLIAMASHGRSGLARITMGSVATAVVRHAPCPVLITRPTDDEGHGGGSAASRPRRL
jgi:nucleotide-binding universal stress UspA family protein